MGIASDKSGDGPSFIADRYRVIALIGEGGMGAVYKVEDRCSRHALALKRLRHVEQGELARRRAALFEREYHLLTELVHPMVIEVYDYGVDEGVPYYTMEFLEGIDLKELPRLDWRQACSLLRDVASSLALLHSRRLVHRDISPRNVRRTLDGKAKLLDFGCMTQMGVCRELVGTPPFLAPEAVNAQPLDGRTDLYALGGLGYWLLTGRHAYGCTTVSQLRNVWRSRPPTVHALVPEVPEELSELIMSLISLTRQARPNSAAEVMERLTAVAGLAPDESLDVPQAYLQTPSLVGRDEQVLAMRKRILRALRGRGSAVMVESATGVGRTRLLDAWVLEGKLAGLAVARATGREAGQHDYGVVRKIASDLLQGDGHRQPAEARVYAASCQAVIPELREQGPEQAVSQPSRSQLHAALVEWLVSMVTYKGCMIVVDDLHLADEPSAAVLAALSQHVIRRAMVLASAVAVDGEVGSPGALGIVREASAVTQLRELDGEQTRMLLASVFGDVPHVRRVAEVLHRLTGGNPRATMEMAQHLVDTGIVRYGAGTWLLPEHLDEHALPESFQDMLAEQVAKLSHDARVLGQSVALAPLVYTFDELRMLTDHSDAAASYRAIDELVASDVFVSVEDGYGLAHRGWIQAFRSSLGQPRARELHLRLRQVFAERPWSRTLEARHLRLAGRTQQALDIMHDVWVQRRLRRSRPGERPDFQVVSSAQAVHELRAAVDASERAGLPARKRYGLLQALVYAAFAYEPAVLPEYLPALLQRLTRDSGLEAWHALDDIADARARLDAAVAVAQERFDAADEDERVFAPSRALRNLCRVCASVCNAAANLQDVALIDMLPTLDPFASLSPQAAMTAALVRGARHSIGGRKERAIETYRTVLEGIAAQEDFAGIRRGVLYSLAVTRASLGVGTALDGIDELDRDPFYKVNALRVRSLFHLRQGDTEKAKEFRKDAELLALSNSPTQLMQGTLDAAALSAHHAAQDLLGLKHAIDRVSDRAAHHRGWAIWHHYGSGAYHHLRGDLDRAIDHYTAALERCGPAEHSAWSYAAAGHVAALTDGGAASEAVRVAGCYLEQARAAGLRAKTNDVLLALSLAQGHAGELGPAIETCEQVIEVWHALGTTGLNLGCAYEVRARLAIRAGDRGAFTDHAALCAREYQREGNLALNFRIEDMVDQARRTLSPEVVDGLSTTVTEAHDPGSIIEEVRTALEGYREDASGRAARALELLLEATGAPGGFLFGLVDDARIELRACSGDPLPGGLADMLTVFMEAETATAEVTMSGDNYQYDWIGEDGTVFRPLVLHGWEAGQLTVVGVAALQCHKTGLKQVPFKLMKTISNTLVEAGDVVSVLAAL